VRNVPPWTWPGSAKSWGFRHEPKATASR
jgi:hypothetical protein